MKKEKVVPIKEGGDKKIQEVQLNLSFAQISKVAQSVATLSRANVIVGRTGYWLGKTAKDLVSTIEDVEKQRIAIVGKYVVKDEAGKAIPVPGHPGMVSIDDNKIEEYNKEIKELFDTEIKVVLPIGLYEIDIDALTVPGHPEAPGAEKTPDTTRLTPEEINDLDGVLVKWLGI